MNPVQGKRALLKPSFNSAGLNVLGKGGPNQEVRPAQETAGQLRVRPA